MIQMVLTALGLAVNGLKRMQFLQVHREGVTQQGSGPGSSELTGNSPEFTPACLSLCQEDVAVQQQSDSRLRGRCLF